MPDTSMAIEVRAETGLPRRGRRRSNADDVNTCMAAATAMFRRLDSVGTGYIHEDQVQWLWPTLTQHVEGAPQNFQAQRQQGGTQVSLVEWQSLMSALCSVVGSRRLKSSLRRADVIVSKGQMTSRAFTPLQSSVTLPLYANFCDLKPASVAAPTSGASSPATTRRGQSPGKPRSEAAKPSSPKEPKEPTEPMSPGRATRERPHTDRAATPASPKVPVSPTAGKTTTEEPIIQEVAADPASPTGPTSPTAGKTTTEEPSNQEVAVDPGSPTGPASPTAGKAATEEPSNQEVAVDPQSPTGPTSPTAGKTTTEEPSNQEVAADPESPTEPASPTAGKTTTEEPSNQEVAVDPGSPTGPTSPTADKTTTEEPSNQEEDANPEDAEQPNDQQIAVIVPAEDSVADPSSAIATSSILQTLAPADAAEAEAFQRRFHALRQKTELPKLAKKKSGKVYQTGVTAAMDEQDIGRKHEVMGVNTHVMTVAAQEERPTSTPRDDPRATRRPSFTHDGPALQFDDQVPIDEPELPIITVTHEDGRHTTASGPAATTATSATASSSGKRERDEDEDQIADLKRKAGESSQGFQPVHLPPINVGKISRAATAPGNLCDENEDLQSILDSSNVKDLKDRLRSEMKLHQQTRNHAKELEKRLQQATKPPTSSKPRFGITSTAPYSAVKTKEKKSVVLPPLKPLKSSQSSRSRSPQRSADGALRSVRDMLKEENMTSMSRSGQSRTRLDAYGRLTRAGLSTWDVRLDEKISRFQDMRAFSDSMWNSFHGWNSQYHSVG